MNGIERVMQRIGEIERRFGIGGKPAENFDAVLRKAEKSAQPPGSLSAARPHIERLVRDAALRHGVDPRLALAVAEAESAFNPRALSDAGAMGVMQLMPETARTLGVRQPYDPAQSADGGVRYLKQMINLFQGDVSKAVAAYNAGPEAVTRAGGIPPYPETEAFVARVRTLAGL